VGAEFSTIDTAKQEIFMSRTFRSLALVGLLATLPATGQAAIITFDTFSGLNGGSPVSYFEAGFAVTVLGNNSLSDVWAAELGAGNPARSMDWDFSNTGPVQSTLAVTRDGGVTPFYFNSLEFQAYNVGSDDTFEYLIECQFSCNSPIAARSPLTGVDFGSTVWTTVNGDGVTPMTTLFITVFFDPGQINDSSTVSRGVGLLLDNINVSTDPTGPAPVPTPATLALFGLGLAGLGWSRRKKA
jgi:PEP-CTERM motif